MNGDAHNYDTAEYAWQWYGGGGGHVVGERGGSCGRALAACSVVTTHDGHVAPGIGGSGGLGVALAGTASLADYVGAP